MKFNLRYTMLALAICIMAFSSNAQQRVKERDIIGLWKLELRLEEAFDEAKEESESTMERIIIGSVSGLVEGIFDNIDIYFEFQPDNDVKIIVEAFDETEIEYGEWWINSKGQLIIEDFDDSSNVNIGVDDDVWMMVDDILVAYDYVRGELQEEEAYMVRID